MDSDRKTPHALAVPQSRLRRFGKLGSMTAGIAGNMALGGMAQLGTGQRPKMRELLLTPRNITRVADQLAQMRGAAMKIGQLMSMDTGDVLPPELANIMARLRDNAHIMPPSQLRDVLDAQWGKGWRRAFQSFDVRPIAAASIGQVHRAQLKDGRELAIKVQYPGVARSIDSDVANVGALIRMSGLLPKGLDLGAYLKQGCAQLHEETDYLREGQQMARFADLLEGDPRFLVPERYADWSTQSILSMSFCPGRPIEEAAEESETMRNALVSELIDLTLKELFVFGVMQTDPNFANYRYRPDSGQIVLLDFGATRDIDKNVAVQYKCLLRAGIAGDSDALLAGAHEIGFLTSETQPRHQDRILRMMRLVFAALTNTDAVDFADTTLSKHLQSEGIALAEDGFAPPLLPLDVLLLQRKFGGMFLLAARLGAKIDVAALLAPYLDPRQDDRHAERPCPH